MSDLPAPLTPPDCDLRDFQFMPLEVARVRRSKQWLLAKRDPEIGFYSINLWMMAWHEVPCGSLEDDDDVLADAAMCDPRKWPKVRDRVLRGWVKCADGRLYHSVVAEKALDSWGKKKAQRQRTEAARIARHAPRQAVSPDASGSVTSSVTENVTEVVTGSKGEGEGEREGKREGEGRKQSLTRDARASRPRAAARRLSERSEPDGFAAWYAAYPRKVGRDAAARAYGAAVKRGVSAADLAAAVASATWSPDPQFIPHPATWLNQGRWKDRGTDGPYRTAEPSGKFDWLFNGSCDSTTIIDGEAA